jgi:hypothetical protein
MELREFLLREFEPQHSDSKLQAPALALGDVPVCFDISAANRRGFTIRYHG